MFRMVPVREGKQCSEPFPPGDGTIVLRTATATGRFSPARDVQKRFYSFGLCSADVASLLILQLIRSVHLCSGFAGFCCPYTDQYCKCHSKWTC